MIRFKKIRWKNFLSTGNVWTEIQLDKTPTTLIVGENGSGKSTFLDALFFGLFGRPFRNINKPQLINSINQKDLIVEIEFITSNKSYKVVRGLKPGLLEIYQNDKLINQNSEIKEYQEFLERNILKLNYKSFSQIVILGSASFTPFMQLTTGARREVIEDLLDIQIFSVMNVLLKEKISVNKGKIDDADVEIKLVNQKIDMLKKHVTTLLQNKEELIKKNKEKITSIQEKIKELEENVRKQEEKKDLLIESIADKDLVKDKFEKYSPFLPQVTSKQDRIKKDIAFYRDNNNCPTCKQDIDESFKNNIIEQRIKQKEDLDIAENKLKTTLDSINERLKVIDGISNEAAVIVSNLRLERHSIKLQKGLIATIEKEIEDIESNSSHINNNEEELKEQENLLQEQQKIKEELTNYKAVLDVAFTLLKDGGIKARIIKQYIPIFNKLINKYLAQLDFFVNFELNENFEETIKSRYRDDFSYDSFSEGEKLRIDLSLLFAWRSIAKLRNSINTNILVMDEIFESSLDNTGTEEFLKLLQSFAKEANIFIISHKGDSLFDKFDTVIRFEKHQNFSRIVK